MAGKKLTVKGFVIIDGVDVPWESLPEAERRERARLMSERASEEMSRYYQNRPEEFARLKEICAKN